MKRVVIGFLFACVCAVGLEISLRTFLGFCDSVLIREDPHYEYIAQPSQTRLRFGNRVSYNSHSMRSDEVDTSAYIILGFGDSILNGGSQVEQDSLATDILSDTLTSANGRKIQFLNISAASWGPDNCFQYLKKHGHFNAEAIYLFVNSDDAKDNMSFEKVVDIDENYPSAQYTSALGELVHRYIIPRATLLAGSLEEFEREKKIRDNNEFNPGFAHFLHYTKQHNIEFTIYLHAMKSELETNAYNEGGEEIIRFAERHKIRIIKALDSNMKSSEFIDDIHINAEGQRRLAMRIFADVQK